MSSNTAKGCAKFEALLMSMFLVPNIQLHGVTACHDNCMIIKIVNFTTVTAAAVMDIVLVKTFVNRGSLLQRSLPFLHSTCMLLWQRQQLPQKKGQEQELGQRQGQGQGLTLTLTDDRTHHA